MRTALANGDRPAGQRPPRFTVPSPSRREDLTPVGGPAPSRATDGVLALIALSAAVALLPWLGKATFPDEGVSLRSARLGWSALWQQSRVIDLVLLPYYSLLHLWIHFSDGIEWARLLSLLAFALTVFLVGHLGARLGGRVCGMLAATLAATCPLLVTAALSARPYALSALAATVSIAALLRWLEDGRPGWLWWFCLAAVATLLLQMFAVLAPLSALAVIIAFRPAEFRERWLALIVPIGLVPAAAFSLAVVAASQRSQIAWIPSLFEGRQLVTALTGPASGEHSLYAAVILVVATAALAVCLRARNGAGFRFARRDFDLLALLVAWAALPAVVLAVASLVKPVFVDRYVTSSAPGMAMAVALLTARAFDLTAARWAERSHRMVGYVGLGAAVAAVWFVCTVPAARAIYHF